jgi:hypothetical protein
MYIKKIKDLTDTKGTLNYLSLTLTYSQIASLTLTNYLLLCLNLILNAEATMKLNVDAANRFIAHSLNTTLAESSSTDK